MGWGSSGLFIFVFLVLILLVNQSAEGQVTIGAPSQTPPAPLAYVEESSQSENQDCHDRSKPLTISTDFDNPDHVGAEIRFVEQGMPFGNYLAIRMNQTNSSGETPGKFSGTIPSDWISDFDKIIVWIFVENKFGWGTESPEFSIEICKNQDTAFGGSIETPPSLNSKPMTNIVMVPETSGLSTASLQLGSMSEKNPNYAYNSLSEICGEDLPKNYTLGTKITRIAKIDRETGTYDLQFWYWLSNHNHPEVDFTQNMPPIDFINYQEITFSDEITTRTQHKAFVTGTFYNDFDFKNYPFEKIDLSVQIEPYDSALCETIFSVERSSYQGFTDDEGKDVSGFKIKKLSTKASIEEYFEPENATYSRVTSSIIIQAPFLETFLQYIFPVFMLTFLAIMVSFIIKDPFQKIELNALFLVSMVFYSQFIRIESTYITDFTIFDITVTISYAIFLVTIIISGIELKRAKKAKAQKK